MAILQILLAVTFACSAISGRVFPQRTHDATTVYNASLGEGATEWGTDDAWRARTNAEIDKVRKSDLFVTVTDSSGGALKDAKVQIEMTQQGFLFGTAVGVRQGWIDLSTSTRFQQIITQNFNTIVFENDLKWPQWQTSQSNTDNNHRVTWTNDAISWAQQRNIKVRGHAMLWGSWRWSPANIPRDPPGLRAAIANHIQDIGSRMNGRLVDWDVLNEPWSENDYTNLLGRNEMIVWFNAARQATNSKLYLNDYPHPGDQNFINYDAECLRILLQGGAPVQGFGIQGHLGNSPWNIQQYEAMMNTFSNTGVGELALTEYDTEITNEQTDANFLRDFLMANFAHPKMKEFLVWGFWDTVHWKGRAPFYRADWTEKPALNVWRELTLNQWWSNVTETTNGDGKVKARVFQGEYNIHVTSGGVTKTVSATVNQEQAVQSLSIIFD